MQLIKFINSKAILMFQTWENESDSRTRVVMIHHAAGGVTLSAKLPYGNESISVLMTDPEAEQLSADITKLIPVAGAGRSLKRDYDALKQLNTVRVDEENGLEISVITTNKGEPYEDGIRIAICPGSYGEGLDLEFGYYAAAEFAAGLAAKV